jgi:hypothetical protein
MLCKSQQQWSVEVCHRRVEVVQVIVQGVSNFRLTVVKERVAITPAVHSFMCYLI